MLKQRIYLGIIAVLCLGTGVILLCLSPEQNSSIGGVLIRLGLMFAVVWLALPDLVKPEHQTSMMVMGIGVAMLVLLAARPQMFRTFLVLAGIGLGVNWVLKRLARR